MHEYLRFFTSQPLDDSVTDSTPADADSSQLQQHARRLYDDETETCNDANSIVDSPLATPGLSVGTIKSLNGSGLAKKRLFTSATSKLHMFAYNNAKRRKAENRDQPEPMSLPAVKSSNPFAVPSGQSSSQQEPAKDVATVSDSDEEILEEVTNQDHWNVCCNPQMDRKNFSPSDTCPISSTGNSPSRVFCNSDTEEENNSEDISKTDSRISDCPDSPIVTTGSTDTRSLSGQESLLISPIRSRSWLGGSRQKCLTNSV